MREPNAAFDTSVYFIYVQQEPSTSTISAEDTEDGADMLGAVLQRGFKARLPGVAARRVGHRAVHRIIRGRNSSGHSRRHVCAQPRRLQWIRKRFQNSSPNLAHKLAFGIYCLGFRVRRRGLCSDTFTRGMQWWF